MPFDGKNVSWDALHLMKAKAYIEEHGWCSYGYENDSGNVCVIAAIHRSGPEGRYMPRIASIFVDVNAIEYGLIGCWNDAPDRTYEVLAAFDRAIGYAMEMG
jgi:hypothetical protein